MKVCDICKNPSAYEHYVYLNSEGYGRKADLCGRCYNLLYEKEKLHKFLAYKETVEEVTNEPVTEKSHDKPKRETWADICKLKR